MIVNQKIRTIFAIYRSNGIYGIIQTLLSKSQGVIRSEKRKRILEKDSLSDRFSEIYRSGYWKTANNSESPSGAGSTKGRSAQYLKDLENFLDDKAQNIERSVVFFDAPCGDMNWIDQLFDRPNIRYHGADIVPSVMSQNEKRFAQTDIEMSVFDITADAFPNADLWHCRDCFFHLSYENIFRSLENFSKSDIPFALLTSHVMDNDYQNRDIDDGDFRFLDLTKAPFLFQEPEVFLRDGGGSTNDPKRIVGLYSRDYILQIMKNRDYQSDAR